MTPRKKYINPFKKWREKRETARGTKTEAEVNKDVKELDNSGKEKNKKT